MCRGSNKAREKCGDRTCCPAHGRVLTGAFAGSAFQTAETEKQKGRGKQGAGWGPSNQTGSKWFVVDGCTFSGWKENKAQWVAHLQFCRETHAFPGGGVQVRQRVPDREGKPPDLFVRKMAGCAFERVEGGVERRRGQGTFRICAARMGSRQVSRKTVSLSEVRAGLSKGWLCVPLLNGIGAIVAGLLALYIVFKKEGVQFRLSSIYGIREDYKRSFPLFVSSISTQIYVNVNKLVVGSCLGMSEVAIYDIGEKVLHLMKLPIQMVAQATFPKISREKNIHFLNRLMFMVAGIVTVGYIIMFVCSKWIVYLFTGEYISEAVTVMRILGLSAILVAFNSFMGGNRLVPFGYSKVYMRVMMQNCIFFLVGMFVLWIEGWINMYSVAGMGVLVEIVCLITLICTGFKLKIVSNYH